MSSCRGLRFVAGWYAPACHQHCLTCSGPSTGSKRLTSTRLFFLVAMPLCYAVWWLWCGTFPVPKWWHAPNNPTSTKTSCASGGFVWKYWRKARNPWFTIIFPRRRPGPTLRSTERSPAVNGSRLETPLIISPMTTTISYGRKSTTFRALHSPPSRSRAVLAERFSSPVLPRRVSVNGRITAPMAILCLDPRPYSQIPTGLTIDVPRFQAGVDPRISPSGWALGRMPFHGYWIRWISHDQLARWDGMAAWSHQSPGAGQQGPPV